MIEVSVGLRAQQFRLKFAITIQFMQLITSC